MVPSGTETHPVRALDCHLWPCSSVAVNLGGNDHVSRQGCTAPSTLWIRKKHSVLIHGWGFGGRALCHSRGLLVCFKGLCWPQLQGASRPSRVL